MLTDTVIPSAAPEPAASDTEERRRPGRTEVVTTLVPLLRLPPDGSASLEAMRQALLTPDDMISVDCTREDGLAPARGILIALCMVIPFWLAIAVIGYYTL